MLYFLSSLVFTLTKQSANKLFKNVKQDRIFIDGLTFRFRKDGVFSFS